MDIINSIIDSAVKAIREGFGEEFHIYTESDEQGFTQPCFFISIDKAEKKHIMGKRYVISCSLNVKVMQGEGRAKFYEYAQKLFKLFNVIDLSGDIVMAKDMSYEIADNVLTLSAVYNIFIFELDDEISFMETIKQERNV